MRFVLQLSRLSAEVVRTRRELNVEDWKLRMRIADYTIGRVRLRGSGAPEGRGGCSTEELEELLSSRLDSIRKDARRY